MDRQGDRFVDVDESCHARLICSLIVKSFGINVPLPHYNLVVFMHIKKNSKMLEVEVVEM